MTRRGFTTNRTSEIMLHRSVRLHIIHVIARGNHELSREARPVILDKCASRHRSTLHPPTCCTSTDIFYLIHEPAPAAFGISRNDLPVNQKLSVGGVGVKFTRNSSSLDFFSSVFYSSRMKPLLVGNWGLKSFV